MDDSHVTVIYKWTAQPGKLDELAAICDPDEVNERAFADQAARIEAHGGREAIIARGDFGYTPAPGQTPVFG